MNRSKAISDSATKKSHEAEITVLNGRLDSLQWQFAASEARVERLEGDLSEARAQVQQVALGALDAQSCKAALAAVQASASDVTSSNNR